METMTLEAASAGQATGFTITYATSAAQTFNYMVVGNPN